MSNQCCNEEDTCCDESSAECCDSNSNECCNMAERLLELADEAWFELLKEKIKKEIESTSGAKMNELAKMVAKANCERWSHKIKGKAKCEEFKHNLKSFFMDGECSGSTCAK